MKAKPKRPKPVPTTRQDEYAAMLATTASALYGIRLFVLDALWRLKPQPKRKRGKS